MNHALFHFLIWTKMVITVYILCDCVLWMPKSGCCFWYSSFTVRAVQVRILYITRDCHPVSKNRSSLNILYLLTLQVALSCPFHLASTRVSYFQGNRESFPNCNINSFSSTVQVIVMLSFTHSVCWRSVLGSSLTFLYCFKMFNNVKLSFMLRYILPIA